MLTLHVTSWRLTPQDGLQSDSLSTREIEAGGRQQKMMEAEEMQNEDYLDEKMDEREVTRGHTDKHQDRPVYGDPRALRYRKCGMARFAPRTLSFKS